MAFHPHWHGHLNLSNTDDSVENQGGSSKGKYKLANNMLTVFWNDHQPDIFQDFGGTFIHRSLLADTDGRNISEAIFGPNSIQIKEIVVAVPRTDYDVVLRIGTSDAETFKQIFVNQEYESPNLPKTCRTIVDLGANIGLAAVLFGQKYPDARILSVEPEPGNYGLLVRNTAALGDRIGTRHAAVWTRNGSINLHTEDRQGASLDAWGVQVSETRQSEKVTECATLGAFLDQAGMDRVDILKVDIEGAELEVFSHGVDDWLPRVDLIIIETHERFRPGSGVAVLNALKNTFEELPSVGENQFFRRKAA